MKNFILIILFLFGCISESISQSKNAPSGRIPLKVQFKPADYNGSIQSWSFDQDSLGILYVANNHGLLEFDGMKWNKYKVPGSTRIRAVKVDKHNRIFVGGQGQIGYFEKTKHGLAFVSLLNLLPPEKRGIAETWKILEYNDKIYFNTESELFVYDNNKIKALTLAGYMRFAFVIKDSLYAQFYGMGLFKLVNDEFIHVKETKGISDIISILPVKDHIYCFAREGQVYELTNAGFNPVEIPIKLGSINDAKKLTSGEYVIATQNMGLIFLNPDFSFKYQLTRKQGLSDRTVKALYEDQFQNLWVALNNGIDYLELSLPFSLLNEEVGVEGTGYAAKKYKNQIYLGTNNGVFTQKNNENQLESYPFEFMITSEGQAYHFSIINDELILNHDRGAFIIKNKKLNQIKDIGNWKFMSTNIPGLALSSGYRGITFFEKKDDTYKKVKNIPDLDESLRMLEFENDSTLWASHYLKGVYRITFDKNMNVKNDIQQFGENDGFPSKLNINVYKINERLVFTSEKGIYDFNPGIQKFLPNDFLNKWIGMDYVSEIVSSKNNAIYFIQNQNIGELNQKGFGNFEKKTDIFKHVNKFLNDDLPNISILDNETVIIGAKEGFILYYPKEELEIQPIFNTFLRSVEIQNSADSISKYEPSFAGELKIKSNQSIKFQFAAPYFDGFKDLTYSYRLLPLDDNWSEWHTLSEKGFDFLPYGKYTFEAKALNIYGNESEISVFSFEVLTPWYFSVWAKIGYFLLVVIAILVFPLVQRKKFMAQHSLIKESKEKALQIKDSQIDKLANEKLQSEINLKNDQLTTTAMQLVKNNEFIKDIQTEIEEALKKKNTDKKLNGIIKIIDKELSNNDSWDKFEYHFDQVHSNYLKKLLDNDIKLSPREIKLAAFLRMNMSSKEISAMLNITLRGVELARYRLRKKLKLERDQNLVEYLIELGNS